MPTFIFRTRSWTAPLKDGIAAVFNGSDPTKSVGDVVEIREVRVRVGAGQSQVPFGSGGDPPEGKMVLARCTSASGGRLLTPAQHQTADAALPSQVEVRGGPGLTAAPVVGGELRGGLDCKGFTPNFSNAGGMSFAMHGAAAQNQANLIQVRDSGGNVEPIVLAEGEGVAYLQRTFPIFPSVHTYELTLTNDVTGASYSYTVDVPSGEWNDAPVFSVMNNTGSGVTISLRTADAAIFNQTFLEVSPPLAAPLRRLVLIDGYVGGTLSTPVSFNTKCAPPSDLACVSGPFRAMPAGEAGGAKVDWWDNHAGAQITMIGQVRMGVMRRMMFPVGWDATGDPVMSQMLPKDYDLLFDAGPGREGIVLGPGTGLAVATRDDDGLATLCHDVYEVEFVFQAYRPALRVGTPSRYAG